MQRAMLEESKPSLRQRALSARGAIAPIQRRLWNSLIQESALRFAPYLAATQVALYSSVETEVETREILAHALTSQKEVFFPRIDRNNSAWFFRVCAETDLRPGRFGICEPAGVVSLSLEAQGSAAKRVIFVPGLAFDHGGHRLGRGGGAYDRMLMALSGRAIFVGLAFGLQILERLPTDNWDQRVHYVITEKQIIDCGAAAPQKGDWIVS